MTNVVHFKVEGKYFNFPRSILELHPDSLLHLMSNEQLHSNYKEAVDVEGDSVRFGFVLDFLRSDGFVLLPITVTMEAFLEELVRFKIENVRIDKILRVLTSTGRSKEKIRQHIRDEINSWNIDIAIVALAKSCATLYYQSEGELNITVPLDLLQPACSEKVWNELHSLVLVGGTEISFRVREGCTKYLHEFGLEMMRIATHPTSQVFEVEMEQTDKESESVTTNNSLNGVLGPFEPADS
jgi:BTB/POZ domain